MKLHNSFQVSLPPGEAWEKLLDIPRVVPCMPGAELIEIVDADAFKGKVSVKLGPVALSFAGLARFVERDETNRVLKVVAQGADQKGRGGANATVTVSMEASASGGTCVVLDTDLNLTGGVAQYGRGAGIIERVASQLIDQFSRNFEAQLSHERGAAPGEAGANRTEIVQDRPAAKPISGFALMMDLFRSWLRGLFASSTSKS